MKKIKTSKKPLFSSSRPAYRQAGCRTPYRASPRIGQEILLTGKIYTARDKAHQRLCDEMRKGKRLPIDLKGAIIYYCGPTPNPPKRPIGSCGPTTSSRMDKFTPQLLSKGVAAVIGKGKRSEHVISSIKRHKALYLVAVGGAGAYFASKVKKAKVVAYKDLGPEAIYELWVEDFPVIVGIDKRGHSIYK